MFVSIFPQHIISVCLYHYYSRYKAPPPVFDIQVFIPYKHVYNRKINGSRFPQKNFHFISSSLQPFAVPFVAKKVCTPFYMCWCVCMCPYLTIFIVRSCRFYCNSFISSYNGNPAKYIFIPRGLFFIPTYFRTHFTSLAHTHTQTYQSSHKIPIKTENLYKRPVKCIKLYKGKIL